MNVDQENLLENGQAARAPCLLQVVGQQRRRLRVSCRVPQGPAAGWDHVQDKSCATRSLTRWTTRRSAAITHLQACLQWAGKPGNGAA